MESYSIENENSISGGSEYDILDYDEVSALEKCVDDLGFHPHEYDEIHDVLNSESHMNNAETDRKNRVNNPYRRYIVNAYDNTVYPQYKVGSLDESRFFTVMDVTGKVTLNKNTDEYTTAQPSKYFYDSPEQYEKHRHCKVSEKIKLNWREKQRKN